MRFSVRVGIAVSVAVLAMAIPMTIKFVDLNLKARRITQLISDNREFTGVSADPCFKKFSGVLVTGELRDKSSYQNLVKLLLTENIRPIRFVLVVDGNIVEKNLE
jgi:hypothetical protein